MKIQKFIFYALSFTWGIIMTLAGLLVAGVLLLFGIKPKKHAWVYYFEVGENWGGFNLGIITITSKTPSVKTLNHEFGHAIQNCMWGPFMPFVISIPSAVRYWYRMFKYYMKGVDPTVGYYDIWFEGEATRIGTEVADHISGK